jgi:hypothetical protein
MACEPAKGKSSRRGRANCRVSPPELPEAGASQANLGTNFCSLVAANERKKEAVLLHTSLGLSATGFFFFTAQFNSSTF